MTRGNQRELARAKNAKKATENKKGQTSSQKVTLTRRGSDSTLIRRSSSQLDQVVGRCCFNKKQTNMDGNKGMTLEARKQRDAEVMRLKQQKATVKKDPNN